jgi:hypothetical protein
MLLDQETEIGQLDGSSPNSAAIDKLLELLSWLTTVPTHYFTGQWPSGVALLNSEMRLNHKVEGHQGRLTSAVVEVVRLCLRLSNAFAGTAYSDSQRITVRWAPPQIETEDLRQERETATVERVTKLVEAQLMSIDEALKELHPDWPQERIDEERERLARVTPPAAPRAVQGGQLAQEAA